MATAGGHENVDDEGDTVAMRGSVSVSDSDETVSVGDVSLYERVTEWSTLLFFGMVTLAGALSGVVDTFLFVWLKELGLTLTLTLTLTLSSLTLTLFVWLKELGGGETCMGAARLVMCAAEVPAFGHKG